MITSHLGEPQQPTVESPALSAAQGGSDYIGVVAGGYDEPIATDIFKVVVNAQSPARFKDEVCRGTIVKVSTDARKRTGENWALRTFGVVEDVNITPSFAFSNAKEMGQSSYYRDDTYRSVYSSTAEDSMELLVRAVGHEDEQGELYGPVRPPERESAVYLAQPEEVRKVLMRPVTNARRFVAGAYATLKGLYAPITPLHLGKEQIFLHGAIFAASGWGKTVTMKHFIQEFLNVQGPPAILVFNIKGQDFYNLDRAMTDDQWEQICRKNPAVEAVWKTIGYRKEGVPPNRVNYYPLSRLPVGRSGSVYCLKFSALKPDQEGVGTLLRLIADANLQPASTDYLIDYFMFFKQHGTDYANHTPAALCSSGQSVLPQDTFANFIETLAIARRRAGGVSQFLISCGQCGRPPDGPSVSINTWSADAILRALRGLERLDIFDGRDEIPINLLFTPGQVSVIDVATNESPRAQEIFIRHILQSIFNYVNRREYDESVYQGLALFLDEAWRFFRSETVLDAVETVSRMGRSLRIGLWLADQSAVCQVLCKSWEPGCLAGIEILLNFRARITA